MRTHRTYLFSFTVCIAVVLLPVLALAQATAPVQQQAWWAQIADYAIKAVASLLGIVAIAFLRKLQQKAGINLTAAQEEQRDQILHKAIHFAEEFAHAQVAKGTKVSGDDKMASATKFAIEQLNNSGLEVKGEKWVQDRLTATLGLTRNQPDQIDKPAIAPNGAAVTK